MILFERNIIRKEIFDNLSANMTHINKLPKRPEKSLPKPAKTLPLGSNRIILGNNTQNQPVPNCNFSIERDKILQLLHK
jgi:hypothetical protein